MSVTSRRARAAALAVTALAATLGLAAPAQAAPAATDPSVPSTCGAGLNAVRSDGKPVWYQYADDTASSRIVGLNLGFVPPAMQNIGGAGDDTTSISDYYVVRPDGALLDLHREGRLRPNGTWKYTQSTTVLVTSGWGGVRILGYGYPYLYAVSGDSLVRWKATYANGYVPIEPVTVAATGFASVRTLSVGRVVDLGGGRQADALLTTLASGALVQLTVPYDTPTAMTSTTLKATGFGSYTSLGTGWCETGDGLAMLGITDKGKAYVYYDADATDGSGADIVGGSVMVAKGWKATAYSQ